MRSTESIFFSLSKISFVDLISLGLFLFSWFVALIIIIFPFVINYLFWGD